jgi:hypothetical protein
MFNKLVLAVTLASALMSNIPEVELIVIPVTFVIISSPAKTLLTVEVIKTPVGCSKIPSRIS